MGFRALKEIEELASIQKKSFWEIILEDDMSDRMVTKEESMKTMASMYHTMKKADKNYDPDLRSQSGLVGQDGGLMSKALESGKMLSGEFMGEVMAKALKMAESNACMKQIVAAPTAGSCGVIPAVLLTYQQILKVKDDKMLEAMYVVAGIGSVIAERASLAGAIGGCQAEVGSASAMAAGALTYLQGGSVTQILSSAAVALQNLMGLVCDPIAGLVEVPCVKRNVVGAVNAVSSCDMAMAGVLSKIPVDEVIDAMKSVGDSLPSTLKETSKGGLAVTPTGLGINEKMVQNKIID